MPEQVFSILTALAGERRHGTGSSARVADLSDGRVAPEVGTLSGDLDRLAAEGLVERDREEVRLRRYYA